MDAIESMILGIGTDIVDLRRMQQALLRRAQLGKRILTALEYCYYQQLPNMHQCAFLGKRFAAKEAFAKAYGSGIGKMLSFQDMELGYKAGGRPMIALSERIQQAMKHRWPHRSVSVHISMSDEKHYANAFAVIEAR